MASAVLKPARACFKNVADCCVLKNWIQQISVSRTSLNIRSSLSSTNNGNNEKWGATTSTVNYHRSTTTKTSARTSDINSEDRGARLHHKNRKNVEFRVFYQQFKLITCANEKECNRSRLSTLHGYKRRIIVIQGGKINHWVNKSQQ